MSDEGPTLAGLKVVKPQDSVERIAMLLWGSSGCGKTTLASTFPGKKLWINFDPDGYTTLVGRDDILVVDFAKEPNSVVQKFKEENPIRIEKFIQENGIESVIFDSLTTFGDKALHHGVKTAQGTPKGRSATLEDPGFSGYGNKNTWTRLAVSNLLRSTGKLGVHCCFIAHENTPTTNEQGQVMFISIMLGSSLNQQVPVNISETWYLADTGKHRRIAIRPCRGYKPMRTRMFRLDMGPEFDVVYDADTQEGDGIATWWELWKKHGAKLPLPGTKEYNTLKEKLNG